MANITQPNYEKNMGIAANYQKYAGYFSGVSAMGQLFGTMADYSALQFQAQQSELQGRQATLIAGEQSNILRERIMKDISNSFATYAAKGITMEGTPMRQAETSLKESGEDIKTLTETAKIEEESREFEASQKRSMANLQLFGGILNAVSGGARTYGMLKGAY